MFGFSKKKRPQLALGLDVKRCAECPGLYTRPCEVDGKTCTFHRFVEESKLILCGETFVKPIERDVWSRRLRDDGVYKSPRCTAEVIRTTLALVEFPDGSLAKVDPVEVTFLDSVKI